MTKASQIMALHAQGKSTREIALEVYGEAIDKRMAYVRIVVRQRKDGRGQTAANKKYLSNPANMRKILDAQGRRFSRKYHSEPEFRQKKLDYHNTRYATDPLFRLKARERARRFYARKQLPASAESAL